jgi:hypothetical protein
MYRLISISNISNINYRLASPISRRARGPHTK